MSVDEQRARNEQKAEGEAERGPARSTPGAAPIGEAIEAFHARGELALGADLTLFSTGGTTQNVHVTLLATVAPGETVVMARNGHKSAFAGLVLSGARPVYVDPVYDADLQVAHGVDPGDLGRVLDAHTDARAVMIFTPT